MNKERFIFLLIVILFFSCQNQGPCDYDIVETQAKVLKIDTLSNGDCQIHLQVYGTSLSSQTQFLNELKNIKTDTAFVRRNKIKIGLEYNLTVSDRLSGSCQERIVSFQHGFK